MESKLALAVKNNRLTDERKEQILEAVESVAKGKQKESNSQEVEISSSRTYKPVIFRWNDEEHSITVDMCVYRVI